MTLYSIPLSQSERDRLSHLKSAKFQYRNYIATGDESFMILCWFQLFYAVSIGDI